MLIAFIIILATVIIVGVVHHETAELKRRVSSIEDEREAEAEVAALNNLIDGHTESRWTGASRRPHLKSVPAIVTSDPYDWSKDPVLCAAFDGYPWPGED